MPGRRALLITNAAAGQGDKARLVRTVAQTLETGGFGVQIAATEAPGHATRLARDAAAAGFEVVFALGGDGTVRETAAGLLGTGVPLAPLPGGTTNVLVRALGLPANPVAAARTIGQFAPRPLSAGWAGDRLFLMQVSGGLDGHVLAHLDGRWKRRFGKLYVAAVGLRRFWRYPYPLLTAELETGERITGSFVVVSNIPLYGGPFRLAPAARTDQPELELIALRSAGPLQTLSFALSLLRGRHLLRRDVERRSVRTVRLSSSAEIALQIDGDTFPDPLPITIRPVEESLTVLAPPVSER